MDFTLTDDEQLLTDTARSLLAGEWPASAARAHVADPGRADELWRHLGDWTELSGQPVVQRCIFAREVGRAIAPTPWFATTNLFLPLAATADLDVGTATRGTVALADRRGIWTAHDDPVKCFVPDADAGLILAVDGPEAVRLIEDGLAPATPIRTIDASRPLYDVDTAGLGGPVTAVPPADLDAIVAAATVVAAADLVGTSRWLLESSVDYAKQRVQFDRPIGSFQAIKHKLADMALRIERAEAAVFYAAMAIDADDPDRHRAVHIAKASAGEAATMGAKDAMQTHGGIGFTYEHDLHLWFRRAIAGDQFLGSADWHRTRLAALLLD